MIGFLFALMNALFGSTGQASLLNQPAATESVDNQNAAQPTPSIPTR